MSREDSPLRDRVIFVVGARRSGTNWLQRVLCAHPEVVGVPSESFFFSHGIAPLTERFQHAAAGSPSTGFVYMERAALADALRDLCDAVLLGIRDALRPGATRVLERTPDHVRNLPLISEIYPDARIVHIIRDGRDVARSLLSQDWGPTSIEEAAGEWRSAVEAGRAAASSLAHYREVRYERLLADPGAEVPSLFAWLGLEAGDEVMQLALSEARARFNVDPSAPSVASGKWKETFGEADLRAFTEVAGSLLAELGYAPAAVGSKDPPARRRTAGRNRPGAKLRAAGRRMLGTRPGAGRKEAVAHATLVQSVVDGFLTCVTEGRFEDAVATLRPAALVRLVDRDQEWRGRGEPGRKRLLETLSSDSVLTGRRIRADVHPAVPLVTIYLACQVDDGPPEHRVLVVGADRARITQVTYYRLPAALGPGNELPRSSGRGN